MLLRLIVACSNLYGFASFSILPREADVVSELATRTLNSDAKRQATVWKMACELTGSKGKHPTATDVKKAVLEDKIKKSPL